jgi:hypothetical protein
MMETARAGRAPEDAAFYLCLSHDVDRIYKTFQRPYEALVKGDVGAMFRWKNPYWQFETVRNLETSLGVKSSFYFLHERRLVTEFSPRHWTKAANWKLYAGRYDYDRPKVRDVVQGLHRDGWEIGLHGSYTSYEDIERLQFEKDRLEALLGTPVLGGRQHYLNLTEPTTWEHHRELGLRYDSSLGSSTEYGFQYGYDVVRPFDDEFVVFPVTVMDCALMGSTDSVEEALAVCDSLLEEARDNGAVMTIDWHQRVFNEAEFPGYGQVYEHLIRRALEMDAWVGPCGELYEWLQTAQRSVTQ